MNANNSFYLCNSAPASTGGINDLFFQNTATSALLQRHELQLKAFASCWTQTHCLSGNILPLSVLACLCLFTVMIPGLCGHFSHLPSPCGCSHSRASLSSFSFTCSFLSTQSFCWDYRIVFIFDPEQVGGLLASCHYLYFNSQLKLCQDRQEIYLTCWGPLQTYFYSFLVLFNKDIYFLKIFVLKL